MANLLAGNFMDLREQFVRGIFESYFPLHAYFLGSSERRFLSQLCIVKSLFQLGLLVNSMTSPFELCITRLHNVKEH